MILMTKCLRKASRAKLLRLAFETALSCLGALGLVGAALAEQPALFESRQITPSGEYTQGIEGPRSMLPGRCSWSILGIRERSAN
jgi:hypothetical protein